MTPGRVVSEHLLEPGTGLALELRRGQVLRVEQVAGGQCADFNCFNLHDYREAFHTGRTRQLHGIHPSVGDFLWSAPPRERPMAVIVTDTVGSNDVLFSRCSGFLFEWLFGLEQHTNCHDIQAEAQRAYGLTGDDVHDSFNMFMATSVDAAGAMHVGPNVARPGDHLELMALMDVLAVPNVCGSDVMSTSGFALKPLRVTVSEGDPAVLATFDAHPMTRRFTNQRTPEDCADVAIKQDRALRRNPTYEADFPHVPLRSEQVSVFLTEGQARHLEAMAAAAGSGVSVPEVLRSVVLSWVERRCLAEAAARR